MKAIMVDVSKTPKGYSASCDLLPGWIVGTSGQFAQLKKDIQESLDFYVECAELDHEDYPIELKSDYILKFKFDIESLLNYYQNILSLAALQRITGVNQRQLSHYANGLSVPRKEQEKKIVEGLHLLANELMSISL